MNLSRVYEGNYVRVKARIIVADPLTQFAPLNLNEKERILLPIKYENIGFYEVCGILGLIKEEGGDRVHGWWQHVGTCQVAKALVMGIHFLREGGPRRGVREVGDGVHAGESMPTSLGSAYLDRLA